MLTPVHYETYLFKLTPCLSFKKSDRALRSLQEVQFCFKDNFLVPNVEISRKTPDFMFIFVVLTSQMIDP